MSTELREAPKLLPMYARAALAVLPVPGLKPSGGSSLPDSSYTLTDQTISPGTPLVLNGVTFSDPGSATSSSSWPFTATIDWGDGTPRSTGTIVSAGTTVLPGGMTVSVGLAAAFVVGSGAG